MIERNYIRNVASLNGRYPLESFGPAVLETLRAGRTAVEADYRLNQDIPSELRTAYDAAQIRAYVGVPLVKAGTYVGGLVVHQAQPRNWTCAEIALIEATAQSTWAAVERARATRQLHASERLRRVALEAADLGVWSVDPLDMTLTTDERFRTIFQGTPDALSYDAAVNAVHPEDSARIFDAIESAMRLVDPIPYSQEYRVLWPDGSLHWVFATGCGHVVNGSKGPYLESFDGTIKDITDHKRAQAQTRENKERNSLLFNAISEGALIIEMIPDANRRLVDYRFLHANPAFERQFGLNDVVGKTALQLVPVLEQYWVDFYGRVALSGQAAKTQLNAQTMGGRWWDVSAYPLLEPGSSKVAVILNDITERKQAEDVKADAEQRERKALKEQDQRKDEFLAMLSHELRNPLVPISNAVQLLRLHDSQDAKQL